MASTRAVLNLKASPDAVWQLIGGFGSIDWVPGIRQDAITNGARVRHLRDTGGGAIVEQLEAYDRAARRYSYSILQSPFPVTDYLATIQVTPASDGTGSHVEWAATFTPVHVSEEEVETLFQQIFSAGLAAAASILTGDRPAQITA